MATNVATSSVGPFLVGMCFDVFGSFLPVLSLFATLPISFAALSLLVEVPRSLNVR